MRRLTSLAPAFALICAAQFSYGCDVPSKPELPDPDTAVTPQMVKAKNDVKAYLADAEKYLKCNISTMQHNRMVEDMKGVADAFNVIVRAYKARMSS